MRVDPGQRGALVDIVTARLTGGALPRASIARWAGEAALAIVGVTLIALSAHVIIPLPFTPVPVTGQTFAVLLVAAAYGARRGLATVLLYLLAGAAGLPVFASVIGLPLYGYLAGFALATAITGWLAERGWDRTLPRALVAMLAGEIAIYLCGLVWLANFVGWSNVIGMGLTPFLIGDSLKLLAAALLLPTAWYGVRAALGREAR